MTPDGDHASAERRADASLRARQLRLRRLRRRARERLPGSLLLWLLIAPTSLLLLLALTERRLLPDRAARRHMRRVKARKRRHARIRDAESGARARASANAPDR